LLINEWETQALKAFVSSDGGTTCFPQQSSSQRREEIILPRLSIVIAIASSVRRCSPAWHCQLMAIGKTQMESN